MHYLNILFQVPKFFFFLFLNFSNQHLSIFMSDYWYWRLILCKETGSCNCFATSNQCNEETEEDTDHRVVVSDIMQLVRDELEVPGSTAGEKNTVCFENCPASCWTVLRAGLVTSRMLAMLLIVSNDSKAGSTNKLSICLEEGDVTTNARLVADSKEWRLLLWRTDACYKKLK